jgi:hypothetical protein
MYFTLNGILEYNTRPLPFPQCKLHRTLVYRNTSSEMYRTNTTKCSSKETQEIAFVLHTHTHIYIYIHILTYIDASTCVHPTVILSHLHDL